jgi:hypothetical protein
LAIKIFGFVKKMSTKQMFLDGAVALIRERTAKKQRSGLYAPVKSISFSSHSKEPNPQQA